MARRVLTNKPLVEAIFELRWELQQVEDAPMLLDPHYKVLIGALYERVKSSYPHHQQLPTATIPDEIAAHTVQHRFRAKPGGWPLIQIGPGIVTLNDTDEYVWEDFERRSAALIENLYWAYPDPESLRVRDVVLRYIDAVTLPGEGDDALVFLRDKLKLDARLCPSLFERTGVGQAPRELDLRFGFPSTRPPGSISLRFTLGEKDGELALIWHTVVASLNGDQFVPSSSAGILEWVTQAHELVDDWFFKLIEGDLERRFR